MVITILSFLGVIIVVILAHEIGHFTTAKLTGVKVEEFGLFYPPRLFSIKRGDTIYSINALPLGGFVKMAGEEDPDAPGSLAAKSILVRLLVLGSGSLMNLLLPFLLLSIAFMVPHDVVTGEVKVDGVAPDSPAASAGIIPGDIIISVNEREVQNINDIRMYFSLYLGSDIPVVVRHADSSVEEVTLAPRWEYPEGQGPVGISVVSWVVVDSISPDSPAASAGLKRGDAILIIDGEDLMESIDWEEISTDEEFQLYVYSRISDASVITVQHADLTIEELQLTPYQNLSNGQANTNDIEVLVTSGPIMRENLPFWEAIPRGANQCVQLMVLFKNGIIGMFTGALPVDLRGPVGIAEMSGEFARAGVSPFLEFASMISINLGIINLFPLPALDGGRLAFVLLEFVRRGKRISPRKEWIIHTTGFFLLIAAILAVTYRDILRIISGE
ncbi:MAG: RIP metalloprotease RseP [Dehalococcoidales bacterium]|nr:MAG: RIP metalloprotease RseP [Dehalococcoidales bacterium]